MREIRTVKFIGILSIVGALTITISGLILGLVGRSKANKALSGIDPGSDAAVSLRKSKRICTVGMWLSIGLMVIAFISIMTNPGSYGL